jgi:Uma2 family endonuclease
VSTLATEKRHTPEDLLAMPDGDRYELVDGELVERHMGFRSSLIGGEIQRRLANFCLENRLGWVVPADAGYQCFPDDPNRVRKPDVSFVRLDRFPSGQVPEGFATIAPDLAVEVVSPNDLSDAVEEKVEEYLAAGVRLVWVVHPPTRTIHVHRADGTGTILRANDELTGADVIRDFRCRVAEIFLANAGTGPSP